LVEIKVHEDRCHGCGNCVVACPVNARNSPNAWGGKGPEEDDEVVLKVVNGVVRVVEEDLCEACLTCELACPVDAIEVQP
jgi:4Fe-4S ferredoxin